MTRKINENQPYPEAERDPSSEGIEFIVQEPTEFFLAKAGAITPSAMVSALPCEGLLEEGLLGAELSESESSASGSLESEMYIYDKKLLAKCTHLLEFWCKNFPEADVAQLKSQLHQMLSSARHEGGVDMNGVEAIIEALASLRPLYRGSLDVLQGIMFTLHELYVCNGAARCNMLIAMYELYRNNLENFYISADYFSQTNQYSKPLLKKYIDIYCRFGKDFAHEFLPKLMVLKNQML